MSVGELIIYLCKLKIKTMRTIEIQAYQFDELNKQTQQKIIKKHYDINVHHDWWDLVYEEFKQAEIIIKGFDLYRREIEIEIYSSYEQTADYIMSYGFNTTEQIYIATKKFLKDRNDLFKKYGENDKIEEEFYNDYDNEINAIEDVFHCSLQNEILRQLNSEYDYYLSDDAIKETIIVNEYEFKKDGERL